MNTSASFSYRLDPTWVRQRLGQAGIRAKHQFGQNFLVDETVLTAVVEAGRVGEGDIVLEIGPGLGVLTEQLLARGAQVRAFEADPSMLQVLQEDFADALTSGQLQLIPGDAVQEVGAWLAGSNNLDYKVVANIPYQITTPLLEVLLEKSGAHRPSMVSLLVQYEVGRRLTAQAGASERSYLSVLSEFVAETRLIRRVEPTAFEPAPAVASAVIQLIPRPIEFTDETRRFLRFVRAGFQQRRKQLKNVLAGIRGISETELRAAFATLGIPAQARAQELTLDQWQALFRNGV